LSSYLSAGVEIFHSVLGDAAVTLLRQTIDELDKELGINGSNAGATFWGVSHLSLRFPAYRERLLAGALPPLVARVLGVDRLWLYEDTVLVKEVGDEPGTPWHQDVPHYPLRGVVATAWVSLDEVDEANGAVRYVPGSHRWGTLFEPVRFADRLRFPMDGLCAMPEIDPAETIWFRTAPGDVIVHDGLIVHGSPKQHIDRRRRAVAVSYVGADVRHHATPFPYQHPLAPHGFQPSDSFLDTLAEARCH
jgi:ectoine hydroxylase-related dioxygenase (phytanoyl-CoA dioxygenase family)